MALSDSANRGIFSRLPALGERPELSRIIEAEWNLASRAALSAIMLLLRFVIGNPSSAYPMAKPAPP